MVLMLAVYRHGVSIGESRCSEQKISIDASNKYQAEKAVINENNAAIASEAGKIIASNPVYNSNCFDASGVQLINKATRNSDK